MRPISAIAVLAGALLAGCSQDPLTPLSPGGQASPAVSISPADGTTGVRLDAPVILTFAASVDRATVERDLHLISERALADSGCPDAGRLSHPDMAHCMADSAMMRHLDAYHAVRGRFSWNPAGTVCTFRPDSMMTPSTRHMIHMGTEMMSLVAGGGMMQGHGSGMMGGHMVLHFSTLDAAGHDGHH